jgi:hypothetical protein
VYWFTGQSCEDETVCEVLLRCEAHGGLREGHIDLGQEEQILIQYNPASQSTR